MLQHFQQWVRSEMCLEGWRAAGEVRSFRPSEQLLKELEVQRPFWAQRLCGSAELGADSQRFRPRALGSGSGKAPGESPQGTVPTSRLGTGQAPLDTREMESEKLEVPGYVDRRRPVKGASNPPMGTARHNSPGLRKGERPWGLYPTQRGQRLPACRGRNVPSLRLG